MRMGRRLGVAAFSLAFILAGVFAAAGLRLSHGGGHGGGMNHVAPEAAAFEIRKAPLVDLEGKAVVLEDVLGGGPAVLNFWATWCAPCRAEMPLLDSAAADIGVPLLGVAVADTPEMIRAFLAEVPVGYGILLAKFDIFYFFQQNGNTVGALPFTVLLDENGGVLRAKTGEFHSAEEFREFAGL